ncbi:MAG TPA: DUF2017 family protein [Microthrixaceae bacterium]|nr:DUF2017 family protein [Microthrixaceae bacterium]
MALFRRPVRPLDDGTYAIELGEAERGLVRSTVDQLADLLHQTDSPALRRLFPPPYGDDVERNDGWAALAMPELIESRLASLALVTESIEETVLDEDGLDAWMRSINDVRLVLGTVLDIDDDEAPIEVDESNAATYQAYEILGMLLETIVIARSERL